MVVVFIAVTMYFMSLWMLCALLVLKDKGHANEYHFV